VDTVTSGIPPHPPGSATAVETTGTNLVGRQRLSGPLVLAALCAGLGVALAGQSGAPLTALLLVAVSGAGKLFYDVTSRTFIQRLLPDHLLNVMFGLQEALMMTGLALGTLAAPILVGLVGPQDAFIAAGCFLPLTAVTSYAALRRLDGGAAVPMEVLALLTGVPFLAVLAPRLVERMAVTPSPSRCHAGRSSFGRATSAPGSTSSHRAGPR